MNTTRRRLSAAAPLLTAVLTLLAVTLWRPAAVNAQWTQPDANNNISNTNTGNVGVGTASPEQSLHVNGPSEILSTGAGAGFKFRNRNSTTNADDWVWYSSGNIARFWRAGVGDLFGVTTAGNFGVGTTSPQGRLHIAGNGIANPEVVFDNAAELVAKNTAGALEYFFWPRWNDNIMYLNYGSAGFHIRNVDSSVSTIFMTHAGNVGLGTTSPRGRLEVANGALFLGDMGNAQWGNVIVRGRVFSASNNIHLSPPGGTAVYINSDFREAGGATGPVNLEVSGRVNGSSLCIAGDCKSAWSQVGGGSGSTGQLTVDSPSGYGARLVVGQPSVDYPGNAGWAAAWNSNILLNGTDSTSISFHDAGARVDTLRVAGGTFNIGENVGWGVANARVHGSLFANGSLGVGTTAPNGKLEVAGGSIFLGDMGNAGWGNVVVRGRVFSASNNIHFSPPGGTTVYINSDFREAGGATGPVNLDVSGTITGGNVQAKYQDVAEWVPSTQKLSPGTVVVLDPERPNQVIASGEAYDTRVAGVVSAQPGITLGERGEGKLLVATTGRVRVKADATRAPIRIGDLLVTGDAPGVAMKSEPVVVGGRRMHAPGTILGKALEPLERGAGEILVLLSLQ